MSTAAAGELGFNSTAATSDPVIYPWRPTDANQIRDGFDIIWGPAEAPKEKPKRKSKWLLKQMKRRGHR